MSPLRLPLFAVLSLAAAGGSQALFHAGRVMAQDMVLTKSCEAGFRRFIGLAEGGALGDDVTTANVAALGDHARVELVRKQGPVKVLVLKPKRTPHSIARYFDIEAGVNANADDVARVGGALDQAFAEDPFGILGLEAPATTGSVPGIGEAWAYGGWTAVLDALERRMMILAGLRYTVGVIVALGLGTLASLVLLWGTVPARDLRGAPRR